MKQVTDILATRLRIGGVWYGRGDPVQLDEEDAAVYRMRGMSRPAPEGTQAKNVKKLRAAEVPVQTKDGTNPTDPVTPEQPPQNPDGPVVPEKKEEQTSVKESRHARRGR
jgi:hypothetical protein